MATVELIATADNFLNENQPDNNYGSYETIRVGDQVSTASKASHSLIKWDVSGIPSDAIIESVYLRLRLDGKDWSGATTGTMVVYRMLKNWLEGTCTWNRQNSSTVWDTAGANGLDVDYDSDGYVAFVRNNTDPLNQVYEIDPTGLELVGLVQGWVDGSFPNYGIKLRGNAPGPVEQMNAHRYCSSEGTYPPLLVVTYTQTFLPTVTTSDATDVGSGGATLNGEVVDDGGDSIDRMGFVYSTSSTPRYSIDSTVFHSTPAVGIFDYAISNLTEGTKYYFYSFAENSEGRSVGLTKNFTTTAITSTAGDGGQGIESSISGSPVGYGGGGGGGVYVDGGDPGTATHGGGSGSTSAGNGTAGTAYTGGGGGGAGQGRTGGAGGSGIVIVRYLTEDAISATPTLTQDLFYPSVTYMGGRINAPYNIPTAFEEHAISSITYPTTNPTITTSTDHHLIDNQMVIISGTDECDGVWKVDATGAKTFKITMTVATTKTDTGTLYYNHETGFTYMLDGYNTSGSIEQSATTFHTGSMKKDYRYISVTHEEIPEDCGIDASYSIDDGTWQDCVAEEYTANETRFQINEQGYKISTALELYTSDDGTQTPLVYGINVIWNFVKLPQRVYSLDCRHGSASGRWRKDANGAIKFLFNAMNKELMVEDRFSGQYNGVIEKISYSQAPDSIAEKPAGLVDLLVREVP